MAKGSKEEKEREREREGEREREREEARGKSFVSFHVGNKLTVEVTFNKTELVGGRKAV